CTVDGTKTAKCDRCDVTDTIADAGSALGHSFTNYVSNNDATCLEDGTKTAKCDRCDVTDTITDEGSATGHNYVETVTNPTCTKRGYTTHTCSICNDSYIDDYVDATGHDHQLSETVAATCSAAGYYRYTCSRCDDTYDIEIAIDPTAHSFGEWTEADGENHVRVCEHNAEHTESAAHEWDDGVETTPPTYTEDGVKTYTCAVCGATRTEAIPHLVSTIVGDIDADGVISLKDISALKAYIAGILSTSEISYDNSDVDGDGVIGLKDISALKILIAD
ncbi:MAG: dockerin type I repeat-containing protein, partial [Clostridia bacterium]|nr:dockerin type I repeat-containing protein [Clostridia bacterium]